MLQEEEEEKYCLSSNNLISSKTILKNQSEIKAYKTEMQKLREALASRLPYKKMLKEDF